MLAGTDRIGMLPDMHRGTFHPRSQASARGCVALGMRLSLSSVAVVAVVVDLLLLGRAGPA